MLQRCSTLLEVASFPTLENASDLSADLTFVKQLYLVQNCLRNNEDEFTTITVSAALEALIVGRCSLTELHAHQDIQSFLDSLLAQLDPSAVFEVKVDDH